MTATDELRRILDERGVEHETETDDDGWAFTRWHGFDDTGWIAASDEVSGMLDLRGRYLFTPEQAIEATLGSDLKAENDKLRELVRDMYQCSRQVGCDHCGDGYRRSCSVLDRMRELGVEE